MTPPGRFRPFRCGRCDEELEMTERGLECPNDRRADHDPQGIVIPPEDRSQPVNTDLDSRAVYEAEGA